MRIMARRGAFVMYIYVNLTDTDASWFGDMARSVLGETGKGLEY